MITKIFLSLAIYGFAGFAAAGLIGFGAQKAGADVIKDRFNIACAAHLLGFILALAATAIAALWGI